MFFQKNKIKTYANACREQAKLIQQQRIIKSIKQIDDLIYKAVSEGKFTLRLEAPGYVHYNDEHPEVATHFKNKGFKVSFGGTPWSYFYIEW